MSGGTVVVQIGCSLKTNRDQKFSLEKQESKQPNFHVTPAASLTTEFLSKQELTTPASLRVLLPLLKVEARVEEQDSSYPAVWPSLVAELMEMVHMLAAYPSQLQSSSAPPSPDAHT